MTETEEALFLSSTPARVGPHRGAGGVRAEDYGHGGWIQGLSAFYLYRRSEPSLGLGLAVAEALRRGAICVSSLL